MKPAKHLIIYLLIAGIYGCGSETISPGSVHAATISIPLTIPKKETPDIKMKSLQVTATAYTSTRGETDRTPNLTAWGDRLKPGMKAIAVSRDLIKMGLTHNTIVTIEGLNGEYLVLDKMNRRWTKKIDIYMGKDRKKALKWGKRKTVIHWSE